MYAVGDPGQEYLDKYDILFDAQKNSREMAKPGVSAGSVDAAARTHLDEHGLGELFIHRTGHGIGMQTHEEPYIFEGNPFVLEPGMAFSIEPGFYDEGRFGARIEDIVVCTETGIESMNNQPHELIVID
jgi:Xaa-Pro dipeptidase